MFKPSTQNKEHKGDNDLQKYLKTNKLAACALQHIPMMLDLSTKNKDNFVFFFGKASPLSQFHETFFEIEGRTYNCAEQYMMYQKAATFGDTKFGELIMAESIPGNQKKLGKLVQGFNKEIWDKESLEIVKRGNLAKFNQNVTLREYLLNTFPKILAESSENDCIWGIGLGKDNENAWKMGTWRGKNYLGFILMEVRHQLMCHGKN